MRLYVYGLVDRPVSVVDLRGVGDEPVEIISLIEGAAVVGWIDTAPPPSRLLLEAQDRLLRALHERAGALLPARFGTLVADATLLVEHPTLQPHVLTPALDQVRGREQMTLRFVTDRPSSPPGTIDQGSEGVPTTLSGRQYLEQRAALAAMPPTVKEMTSAVAALVRAERSERGRVPGMLATVHHLIDRGRAADYRAAMGARASARPELSVIISGPAPAYAFGPTDPVEPAGARPGL